jgi:hypothetical protein
VQIITKYWGWPHILLFCFKNIFVQTSTDLHEISRQIKNTAVEKPNNFTGFLNTLINKVTLNSYYIRGYGYGA